MTPFTAATVAAALQRFSFFLIADHAAHCEPHCRNQNGCRDKSSHNTTPFYTKCAKLVNAHRCDIGKTTLVTDGKLKPLHIVHLSPDRAHCCKTGRTQ